MSINWRVYTSHHTGHFSKRQRLPGDCFSPLIEDHAPKYRNSCDSALRRIWRVELLLCITTGADGLGIIDPLFI